MKTEFPNAVSGVMPALKAAAARTGVDFSALLQTAKVESSLNPDAKAPTSTATGLFQFIESTWLSTLSKHGRRHGIEAGNRADALALRRNPWVASLMAAEHMGENRQTLEKGLGRAVGGTDLYLAHFLGSGGALKFLRAMAVNPAMTAADLLPAAARANKAIFFDGAAARTLADVHGLLARKLGAGTDVPPDANRAGTDVPLAVKARVAEIDPRIAIQAARLLIADLGA
ncbi:MAG: transglycosylase SLT domain-containing protein [Sphingomonadaceae bacterium]